MIVTFFNRQDDADPLNGSAIEDDERLVQLLDSYRASSPFFSELRGDNGYNLLIGMAGVSGCAQFSRSDGRPPYLMAVAVPPTVRDRHLEFLAGNTLTPVQRKYILRLYDVKTIAVYFRQTGERDYSFAWEEV